MSTFTYRVSTKICIHFQCYNLPELLDVVLDESDHFAKRLIDIGNGRFSAFGQTVGMSTSTVEQP